MRRAAKPFSGEAEKGHLVDFVAKKVTNVNRSTFSAELFSLCDACDHALLLRQICHEFDQAHLLQLMQDHCVRAQCIALC